MLSELSGAEKVAGVRQARRALSADRVQTLYLARDADPDLAGPLAELARERGVPVAYADDMLALGRACGIPVGTAAAAVLRG